MLIDTHVHLNDEQYDDDLSEVITRAREAGVDRMFVVGFNKSTIERAMKLIDEYDFYMALSVGIQLMQLILQKNTWNGLNLWLSIQK